MNKRWYDTNPTVSLAVSLLKNAKDTVRQECASFVIKQIQDKGVVIKNNIFTAVDYTLRRWYDDEENIFEAMEYLRVASTEIQQEISFEIIHFLEKSSV